MNDVESKIKQLVMEQAGIKQKSIASDRDFDSLGLDSLDKWEIVMAVEETFDFPVADEEVQNLKQVQDLINLVNDKLKEA